MEQGKKEKLLFELSYLNTSALFALRERVSPLLCAAKTEGIWETALMKTSRHLRG